MRAVVVFESMFGNTKAVAEAVAEGVSEQMPVTVVEVGDAPKSIGANVDLVVVGAPTHAFGLSRAQTRADAARQASHGLVSKGIGLREWLSTARAESPGIVAAAFDTRIRHVPGSAARAARRRLRDLGYRADVPAESFFVAGTPGPLADGELARARKWGNELATTATSRAAHAR